MSKTIVATQNFFVDTTNPQAGECRDATFVLPQGLLDCAEHQEMRITLNSFSMPKNWYNINQNNSVFYIVGLNGTTVTATRVEVEHGNYQYFGNVLPVLEDDAKTRVLSLADNIEYAIKEALSNTHGSPIDQINCNVVYHHQTGLYRIHLELPYSNYTDGVKIVTFTIPDRDNRNPANIVSAILNTPNGSHASQAVNSTPAVTSRAMIGTPPPPATPTQFSVQTRPLKASDRPVVDDIVEWTYNDTSFWMRITFVHVTDNGGVALLCDNHGGAISTSDMPAGAELYFVRPGTANFNEVTGTTLYALNFVDSPRSTGTNVNTNYNISQYQDFVIHRNAYLPSPPGPFANELYDFNILQGYTLVTPNEAAMRVAGYIAWNTTADTRPITASTIEPPLRSLEMEKAESLSHPYTGNLSISIVESGIQWTGNSRIPSGGTLGANQAEWDLWDDTAEEMRGAVFVGQQATGLVNGSAIVTEVQIRSYDPGGASPIKYACTVTFDGAHGGQPSPGSSVTFTSEIASGKINGLDDTHQNYWKTWLSGNQTVDFIGRTMQWNARFNFNPGHSLATPIITEQALFSDIDVVPEQNFFEGPLGTNIGTLLETDLGDYVTMANDRRNWFRIGGMGSVGVMDAILLRNRVSSSKIYADAFQSFYEVAGGCYEDRATVPGANAVEQFNNLKSMFSQVLSTSAAGNKVVDADGHYPATLQTMENLYLRSSLNSMNFQSPGFDSGLQTNIAQSQVLAKIPIGNTYFAGVTQVGKNAAGDVEVTGKYMNDVPYYTIYYTDNGNNNYSIILTQKRTSQLRLFLTDKYGRLIPAVSQQQVDCGQLGFTASLRVDIFEMGHI